MSDQTLPLTEWQKLLQHISEHVLSFELNTTQVADSKRQEYPEATGQHQTWKYFLVTTLLSKSLPITSGEKLPRDWFSAHDMMYSFHTNIQLKPIMFPEG